MANDVLPPPAAAAGVLPGLIWAFRIHADGVAEELPPDKPIDDRHDG